MVSILEKKMSTNSRLPPSLLSFSEFWEALDHLLKEWMFDTLGLECETSVITRKNIDAKEASDIMAGATSYIIMESGDPLPAGILLGSSLMTQYAAFRLSESPSQLDGTSPVFLQLLCEDVTKDLLYRISGWMAYNCDQMSIADPSYITLTTAALNKANRYVLMVIQLTTDEAETFEITMVVELEGLIELHKERLRNTRAASNGGGASNPTLRGSVRRSLLDLEVVIDHMDMTVGECHNLTIGQEIPLPSGNRGQLNLIAKTSRGDEKIARGELGTWKNFRALKLSTPVSDGFLRNMMDL